VLKMSSNKSIEKIHKLEQKAKAKKILPYTKNKNAEIRAAAALALGCAEQNDSDVRNQLLVLLRDPEVSVCIGAIGGLKKMGCDSVIDHLRHVAKNTDDENVKTACNEAVATILKKVKESGQIQ
jgi:HEAT repeat protein